LYNEAGLYVWRDWKLRMYRRFGKRVFDLTAAAVGLVVMALPMGGIAILVRATSRGPALFRQTRVGRDGELFTVRKFRTMSTGHGDPSPVTVRGDSRIIGVGRVLRRFKLDEYPQLWNVVVGEMSLVGPRPDVPGYCDKLEGGARRILDLRPGITGPATIKYADEEEILAAQADPVRYNDEVIFPDKVRLNLEYLENHSFRGDLGWIWKTLTAPFASKSDI
jgi:lipopolysaccharide/colanic/teichoic acid biosynthesis glycosyltransferase